MEQMRQTGSYQSYAYSMKERDPTWEWRDPSEISPWEQAERVEASPWLADAERQSPPAEEAIVLHSEEMEFHPIRCSAASLRAWASEAGHAPWPSRNVRTGETALVA